MSGQHYEALVNTFVQYFLIKYRYLECSVFTFVQYIFNLHGVMKPGLKVIKLEYSLRLKIKDNDWLLADTYPQAANACTLF